MISLHSVSGDALEPYISDLARLRIQVFREYPYLYEGSLTYEQRYLSIYLKSPSAIFVLAIDDALPAGEQVVGASSGVAFADEDEAFQAPFIEAGIDTQALFYCAESVLLPSHRGQGIYKAFFAQREGYARQLGFQGVCFCGVVRPDDHPLRPAGYQPLDSIWQHFGYQPQPDLIAHYCWQDIDQTEETSHPMMFWTKTL